MEFKKITENDFEIIDSYCRMYGENSCQHSFVNLYTLGEKYGSKYCIEDNFLFVLRENLCDAHDRVYLFPMGAGDLNKAIDKLIRDAHAHNAGLRFYTITDKSRQWLSDNYPGLFSYEALRDMYEYIHLSDTLIHLPGRAYAGIRNDLNHFRRKYATSASIEYLTHDNIKDVLAFEKKWFGMSAEDHDRNALELEAREIEKQLSAMDMLRISGLIIRIDGEVQGFVYGAPVSDSCYDVLIEKGNRGISDIYRALHQQISERCASGYKYINREEDVGVSGLRQAKLSYKPEILLAKYIATEIR